VTIYNINTKRETHKATAACIDCGAYWEGPDARLQAIEHCRRTTHKVSVQTSRTELIEAVEV
jgi:hypothetical protein